MASYRLHVLAFLLLCTVPAQAQLTDLRLPISLDADSTDYDGKNSMLRFRGLRLTQGNIGIQAEEGRASNLDFENSVWRFSGNVIIDIENGHIECDTADLQFADHQLTVATIGGAPATFELTRPGSEETTYAEAGKLRYNLLEGTVEFSEDATITEGGNKIASNYLIYNIVEQRINAQGSPGGEDKVRITYTPKEADVEGGTGETTGEDNGEATEVEIPPADEPDDDASQEDSSP